MGSKWRSLARFVLRSEANQFCVSRGKRTVLSFVLNKGRIIGISSQAPLVK